MAKKKHHDEGELASVLSTIRDVINAHRQDVQSMEDDIYAVHQDMRYVREIDKRMKAPSALYLLYRVLLSPMSVCQLLSLSRFSNIFLEVP